MEWKPFDIMWGHCMVGWNPFTTSCAEDLMSAIAEVAFFEWEIILSKKRFSDYLLFFWHLHDYSLTVAWLQENPFLLRIIVVESECSSGNMDRGRSRLLRYTMYRINLPWWEREITWRTKTRTRYSVIPLWRGNRVCGLDSQYRTPTPQMAVLDNR